MSYEATVIKIMIASPSDVPDERRVIREVIHEWNAINSESIGLVLMPVGWETHASPEFGPPQEIINKQVLEETDLLVATFWTRVGSATNKAISGTIEEIEHHIGLGKKAMLYFSSAPISPDKLDNQQLIDLNLFKKECQARSLYEPYTSLTEFQQKFNRQLSQAILRYFGNLAKSKPESTDLKTSAISDDAKSLLISAAKDVRGEILKIRSFDGLSVSTNNLEYVQANNPISEAIWEAAMEELVEAKFIDPRGVKGEIFRVTKLGYEISSSL